MFLNELEITYEKLRREAFQTQIKMKFAIVLALHHSYRAERWVLIQLIFWRDFY
jgi:hypothetical protein